MRNDTVKIMKALEDGTLETQNILFQQAIARLLSRLSG
jgi:hypothetical protein